MRKIVVALALASGAMLMSAGAVGAQEDTPPADPVATVVAPVEGSGSAGSGETGSGTDPEVVVPAPGEARPAPLPEGAVEKEEQAVDPAEGASSEDQPLTVAPEDLRRAAEGDPEAVLYQTGVADDAAALDVAEADAESVPASDDGDSTLVWVVVAGVVALVVLAGGAGFATSKRQAA